MTKPEALAKSKRLTIDAIADRWAGAACMLDGKPAKVTGRLNQHATVAVLPDGYHCEFTWRQVDNVMTSGGRFISGMTEVLDPYPGSDNLSCYI